MPQQPTYIEGDTTAVAVKIKLKRLGKVRQPFYRVVVMDARAKRDGRAIEEIGKYGPKEQPSFIEVNSQRAQHWLSIGAQPTEPVRAILRKTGDWQLFHGQPLPGPLEAAEAKPDKKAVFEAAAKEAQVEQESRTSGAASAASAETAEPAPAEDAASAEAEEQGEGSRSEG